MSDVDMSDIGEYLGSHDVYLCDVDVNEVGVCVM